MFIIKYKKIFISISIALVILSFASLFTFGLNFGIDFKGGALMEVTYKDVRPAQTDLDTSLKPLNLGSILIQPTGDLGYIIKTKDISDIEHSSILSAISEGGKNVPEEKSFSSIGPSVGKELTRKAVLAIVLVSLGIILFIAYAFRKVSKPVSSWRYGFIAIVTLLHDVMIPVGLFTILSHYYGAEVDTLFVVAILTVLGLSVSDTIVVFDRIRENIKNRASTDFHETVGKSLEQVYPRSINTSLTVILVLLCLFFFGPSATKYFSLMMIAGMFFGTYSSIFLASPLLVWIEEFQNRNKK
ncbi:MAG: protein translocase subunit SecF [Candidatus Nomurabacteria bacterium]|nr:protein translocase subunit SecF [Candidatus Nomurabacteria bacterium]